MPTAIIRSALGRIELTWDPLPGPLAKAAADAHAVGFLQQTPDLAGIVEAGPLNRVLAARGLGAVAGSSP
jgi:hypothetical protein